MNPPPSIAAFDCIGPARGRSYVLERRDFVPRAGLMPAEPAQAVCVTRRLFIDHKPTPPSLDLPITRKPGEGPRVASLFLDGSRVDIPARRDDRPDDSQHGDKSFKPQGVEGDSKVAKRGIVRGFSHRSRARLLRTLGKLRVDEPAYTFALTLPDDFRVLPPEDMVKAFGVMGRRFSKSRFFRKLSAIWKREFQLRGALHYHLVFYGVECPILALRLREWLVSTWLELMSAYYPPEDIEKMRAVHAHDSNWIRLTGTDFTQYFAKYLSKCEGASQVESIPGRWWGSWNKSQLPFAEESRVDLPEPVADDMARVFYKRREKRVSAALARRGAAAVPMSSPFGSAPLLDVRESPSGDAEPVWGAPPPLTPWDVQRLKMGYTPTGRNPEQAALLLRVVRESCRLAGVSPSTLALHSDDRIKFPVDAPQYVVGLNLPALALRVIENSSSNRGVPVPRAVPYHEKKTEIMAAASKVRASALARRSPSQADLPWEPDSVGVGGCGDDESRRRAAATQVRRRLGSGFAGVVED